MATIAQAVAPLASTSNVTSYPSSSFTPSVNDLLVVAVWISDHLTQDATPLSSSAGYTFTQALTVTGQSGAGRLCVFVANSLVTAAAAQTVTYNAVADAGTGAIIVPHRVTGMTLTGASAIKQANGTSDMASGSTPAVTLTAAATTTNPLLGVVAGTGSNPMAVTQPAGWTEFAEVGYNTPASGMENCHRDSGETASTITWGSNMFDVAGAIVVELDAGTGAAPARPHQPPRPALAPWASATWMKKRRGILVPDLWTPVGA